MGIVSSAAEVKERIDAIVRYVAGIQEREAREIFRDAAALDFDGDC